MIGRILIGQLLTLLAFQGVFSAVSVALFWPDHTGMAALGGIVLATVLWRVVEMWRAMKVLRWLRDGGRGIAPERIGVWGEVGDRVRRLVREHERALEQSDGRLQDFLAAMQASPSGVVLLDAQGRIEWLNHTAAAHFGLHAQRDLLQYVLNLVRDPQFAEYMAAKDFSHDVLIPGKSSSASVPVRLSVQMHPYGDGRSLLLSRDVTALEQAEAMRRDFVANVSHEIRTPLTVLAGFVETLQSLPLAPTEQQHYLSLMEQQAQRMQTLVSDLLELSRLEGSPLPSMQQWVDLDPLLQNCAADADGLGRVLWGQAHVLSLDTTGVALAGHATELHSAIYNLVSNAVRYTPADKAIRILWQWFDDGSAALSVQDEGPGIPAEHLPRLTERFYRVDRSRSREAGGTGLGLAIVKHVAQRHGLELRIRSVVGQGSVFTLVFPATRLRRL